MKKRLICRSTHFSSKDKAERFIKKSPAPIKDAGDFFNSRFFCDFIFLLFKSYCNFAFSFIPFFLIINLNYNFVFHIIVICKRISQNTVQADFKVQMVSRRVPRTAYACDCLSFSYLLADGHIKSRTMRVKRRVSVSMTDYNIIAIA